LQTTVDSQGNYRSKTPQKADFKAESKANNRYDFTDKKACASGAHGKLIPAKKEASFSYLMTSTSGAKTHKRHPKFDFFIVYTVHLFPQSLQIQ
jgi:hypothetical protein